MRLPLSTMLLAILAVSLLAGCQNLNKIPLLAENNDPFTEEKNQSITGDNVKTPSAVSLHEFDIKETSDTSALRFTKDDELKIGFWGYEELDHVATVQGNGRITVPLVGEIIAERRTASQIKNDITERLKKQAAVPHPTLRHGDKVSLFVWQNQDLNMSTVVQPEGIVTFPLVGRIKVAGRRPEEIDKEIKKRLSRYIKDPKAWLIPELQERKVLLDPRVSVLPWKLKSRKISVLGEVSIPGVQPLHGGMRIMEALSAAQITNDAKWNSVIVIRSYDSEKPSYRRLKLADFIAGESPGQNIVLQEGDIVVVSRTAIAQVGLYIDQFFSKTRPIFDWWLAGNQALRYDEIIRLNLKVNEAAKRAFEDSAANPTVVSP